MDLYYYYIFFRVGVVYNFIAFYYVLILLFLVTMGSLSLLGVDGFWDSFLLPFFLFYFLIFGHLLLLGFICFFKIAFTMSFSMFSLHYQTPLILICSNNIYIAIVFDTYYFLLRKFLGFMKPLTSLLLMSSSLNLFGPSHPH